MRGSVPKVLVVLFVVVLGACTARFPDPMSKGSLRVQVFPQHYSTFAERSKLGYYVEVVAESQSNNVEEFSRSISLVDSCGSLVSFTMSVGKPSLRADWCKPETQLPGACVEVIPSRELAEGWYELRVGVAAEPLLFPPQTPPQLISRFHIGSLPLVIEVNLAMKAGLAGFVRFSEPVTIASGFDENLKMSSVGASQKQCARQSNAMNPNGPVDTVWYSCPTLSVTDPMELQVTPGILSATNVALKDLSGNTSFTIALPAAKDGARVWTVTGVAR